MKILICDKDGTLVRTPEKFGVNPAGQQFTPGIVNAIKNYVPHTLLVVSNQGEISRGHKTFGDTLLEMEHLWQMFTAKSVSIFAVYFCPDMMGRFCYQLDFAANWEQELPPLLMYERGNYRKPQPGMLELIQGQYPEILNPDVAEVLFVGDSLDDEQAAAQVQPVPMPFIWVDQFIQKYG
ncbi:MAG: HAD-IIIA family hydrolase [Cyanobacteria bacterium P01_G01_bin.54]